MVEESLYSLTRCFGDLYAQHHGVSAEPEVRIVTLDELEAAGWRTPLVLLGTGSVRAIDRRTAYWAFRIVKHSARGLPWRACLEKIEERQREWERRADALLDAVADGETTVRESEEAVHALAEAVLADWWRLLDELLLRYGDGWEHEWDADGERRGKPIAYPARWLARLGFEVDEQHS